MRSDAGRSPPVGVLVMAYGTPSSYEDVLDFYTDVRRGSPPSPDQLADLQRRYRAVGGISELAARTAEQVSGIAASLEDMAPGRFVTAYGAKHASPSLEDAIGALAEAGASVVVGIVLAPHYSVGSIGEYVSRAGVAAKELGLGAVFVEDWHENSVLIELLAERVTAALERVGSANPAELLVTAHSLPRRIIEGGDGYDDRLRETGALVAAAAGIKSWRVAWQSAGRTPEPWIGPDVLEVMRALPGEGVEAVIVCPAGFTSDHLEVSYDLDIEACKLAEEIGLAFARTDSLNADPRLCEELARLVSRAAADAGFVEDGPW